MKGFRLPVFLAICAGIILAQDYRATVQGLVVDSSQALIVGATVTLSNVETGVSATRVSNGIGRYRFDFVTPGTYTVTAESAGFNKAVQENVLVQTRADVTVDFTLKPGGTTETVTVTANAVELQFNTSTKELTVDRKQLMELPVMGRSPYTLALLDPGVVDAYGPNRPPYYMWAAGGINVSGRTARQNDVLIDGAPVQIGPKGSYTPVMDAVQEFSIQQNSVDAEFGHSAGGIVNLAMREGTNEIHGTAFYFGRNPKLNAVPNSITHQPSLTRNHDWGGTAGGPIRKNRLFTFVSYEGSKVKDPATSYFTMPTDVERTGDFSKSRNAAGGLRTIYDPYTTIYDAANNVATRMPFANNVIPQSQIDPTARKMMDLLWGPNNPGDNPFTGINNFKKSYSNIVDFWNFSDRTDWNISDKLKVFGRYSRFHTQIGLQDYTPNHSLAMPNGAGGLMASRNIAGDAVYTLNPNTVLNFRFSYAGFADDYNAPDQKFGKSGLAQLWGSNAWYQPYLDTVTDIYFPSLTIGSNSFGRGYYWIQEPHSYNISGKVARNAGKHNLKAGIESRQENMFGAYPNLMGFGFTAAITADTFLNPNTNASGDPYASFLLGALTNSSYASSFPMQDVTIRYYGAYVQDDYKLSRNVTLNLGLRYEFETAPVDSQNRFTRYIDFTNPIPEFQSNPPAFPASVAKLRNAPVWNGAWVFADSSHRGPFDTPKLNFAPRAGVAIRLNNRTALLAGFGRFLVPSMTVQDGLLARSNFPGYAVTSNALPLLAGVPQGSLSNPFPASTNPLQPVTGKSLGRYTNLGNGGSYRNQDYRLGVHDRFNFTLQRELPYKFKLDATFFMTFAHDLDSLFTWDTFPANNANPDYVYNTLKGEAYATVANPFYHYLTPDKFPGQLRNRDTVSVLDLLRPYPQYGDIEVSNVNNQGQRYKALQLKLQRAYANGFSMLWAYNYNRSQVMWYRNDIDYYNWAGVYREDDAPRHRMNFAATYDLPFGKGRPWLGHAHPAVNAVLGGWSVSPLLTISSGKYLLFWDDIVVNGSPAISNKTPQHAFNTTVFAPLPAFTPRTAPLLYDGVTGPRHWNIDTSLAKNFPIREGMKLEFRLEAYNMTNSFIWSDPDAGFWNATFGRSTGQANIGRQVQYTLRLVF